MHVHRITHSQGDAWQLAVSAAEDAPAWMIVDNSEVATLVSHQPVIAIPVVAPAAPRAKTSTSVKAYPSVKPCVKPSTSVKPKPSSSLPPPVAIDTESEGEDYAAALGAARNTSDLPSGHEQLMVGGGESNWRNGIYIYIYIYTIHVNDASVSRL